ncbi:MAG: DUF6383 domain-containing protein [Tannerella sp.]|nr:DUF6383 domain-containing protein [Tannerella sp.]
MLFSMAFTVNAAIIGGNLSVGDTVRSLPDGTGLGLYHIRIDSIYVGGTTGWIGANDGSSLSNSPIVSGSNYIDNGDTIVLGVTEGGKVIPVSMNDLRHRHGNDATYKDLQSTMWCIGIERGEQSGQMPTFHFTNKAFNLELTIAAGGDAYVGENIGEKGWMYSYSYKNGQLNYSRPIYRYNDASNYTVLTYNNSSHAIKSEISAISNFVNGTVANMLKFTIVEVAPVVLDANAFNTRLGESANPGLTQLSFDPAPNSTIYPNYFGYKLAAVDGDKPGYLNLYVDGIDKGKKIYNIANTGADGDRYTNELGENYIRILANGSYNAANDNDEYRFVYFPSKDSLVINAFSVGHAGHSAIANGVYRDGIAEGYLSGYTVDAAPGEHHYYGLYNDTIQDVLIVRLQDLYRDGSKLLTIGEEPANTRISFGIDNCNAEIKGWQPQQGIYTIWNSEGRCLGIRLYNGSLVPQWMELEEGECPDRIPSYQWVVEHVSDKQSYRVNITNREFGDIPNDSVKMKNVLIKKDTLSSIFYGQTQFIFTYDPLVPADGKTTSSIRYGWVNGRYLKPMGDRECGISDNSGFRPVTPSYVIDKYLGYKYFYVNTNESSVSFGKSDDVGSAKGMDYNAFAFNYYNIYDPTKYIDLKENRGESVLHVNKDGGKEAFQFLLGTTLRSASNRFATETYGYPKTSPTYTIDEIPGTRIVQRVPVLERYYYELKVADFYDYRDGLAEQFVVLKGAADDGSDVNNKLNYGVADKSADADPFKFANVYLRETYFLEEVASENEERKEQDLTRRVYYAILDRIEGAQLDRVGDMGLEVSDTIKGDDESSSYNLVMWRVHETEDGIIKAQGKTVSSARVSTFALENVNYPLYRRLNSKKDDVATAGDLDAPKTLRIYTQYNKREFLFEDALSADADNMGINFLGLANADQFVENVVAPDGTIKYNYNLYIDTAYIKRGTGPIKPQYLIAVDVDVVEPRSLTGTYDLCNNYIGHIDIPAYTRGRYLINATDSARRLGSNGADGYPVRDKRYITSTSWDRLAFVDAIHVNDRLYIVSELQKRGIPETYLVEGDDGKTYVNGKALLELDLPARKPLSNLSDAIYGVYYDFAEWNNYHNDVTFSLRFVKSYAQNADVNSGEGGTDNDSKQFLIESETTDRTPYGNRKIAPVQGGWIKIDNGIPVLSRSSYDDAISQAEIFNVVYDEEGDGVATSNDPVTSEASLTVVSGIGELSILNANGKDVTITNILGQKVIATTLNSDNVTLKVPKGIVVVTVDGDSVKAIVK